MRHEKACLQNFGKLLVYGKKYDKQREAETDEKMVLLLFESKF